MEFATVNTVILLLVTFLVTAGIKSISTLAGKDLSGLGAALTAGVVGLIIGIFNSVIVPRMIRSKSFWRITSGTSAMIPTVLSARAG